MLYVFTDRFTKKIFLIFKFTSNYKNKCEIYL